MDIRSILKWIKEASDEDSKTAVNALVERRKEILAGGDVIYEEHTREEIDLIREFVRRAPAYRAYKECKEKIDC